MKGMALILAFLPLTLAAQEPTASGAKNQADAASQAQAEAPSTDASLSTALVPDPDGGSNSDPGAQQQPNAKPAHAAPPNDENRPRLPGSMVGYIGDPIPESQIRIRFDDAFDDQFPDRSEFLYAKCSCYRGLQTAIPPAYDPNASGPGPGVPNSLNYQQLYMNVEYSPYRRFSAFVEVPIRWLQPQGFQPIPLFPAFSNQSGLSDVTAGLKFAVVASEGTYVTFQFMSYFPTGDSSQGLGTNHYSIEPSLLLYHRLSSRFTLEGELGDWHPIGGSAGVPITGSEGFAGDVFFYGIGPSYRLYSGNRVEVAPVVELVGWHVLSGFQTQPVTGPVDGAAAEVGGMNIVNLKVGVRTSIGFHDSFYVGFGQALTHDDWYEHILRLEYRHTF
ncbi:MAG: transporter [Candidatus Acidiferrales bacterium]